MDENTFSSLVKQETELVPRQAPRVAACIPIMMEIKGQIFRANIIDISPTTMRIDQNFSITFQDRLSITVQTDTPFQILAQPVITSAEFDSGNWNRLLIRSTFNFEKLVKLLPAQKAKEAG